MRHVAYSKSIPAMWMRESIDGKSELLVTALVPYGCCTMHWVGNSMRNFSFTVLVAKDLTREWLCLVPSVALGKSCSVSFLYSVEMLTFLGLRLQVSSMFFGLLLVVSLLYFCVGQCASP